MGEHLPEVSLGTGRKAVALSSGWYHTCAILNDHSLKCWGEGRDGRLGTGEETQRGIFPGEMGDDLKAVDLGAGQKAKSVSCGKSHTCVVLEDGSAKCFGTGSYGELGYGDEQSRGHSPETIGDKLPVVNLGTKRVANQLAASDEYTCAVLDTGEAKCWGRGGRGRLGTDDEIRHGAHKGDMGDSLPVIDFGSASHLTTTNPSAPTTTTDEGQFWKWWSIVLVAIVLGICAVSFVDTACFRVRGIGGARRGLIQRPSASRGASASPNTEMTTQPPTQR
jgi:hypothetical protein